ncbi:hypothetical protein OPV22_026040 [Ensete ventricosum]|uniref:Phospholipid scramblase n=1 Tax=Ensete ventricosum TaxID=4639 RepID=A0AAV8Q9K4_ENSVE|nr:hypothetical protein OPV22_026040 [Ensete ventricosum]
MHALAVPNLFLGSNPCAHPDESALPPRLPFLLPLCALSLSVSFPGVARPLLLSPTTRPPPDAAGFLLSAPESPPAGVFAVDLFDRAPSLLSVAFLFSHLIPPRLTQVRKSSMGTKVQQNSTDSRKAEIDTRVPFESVKAAVSLFGEVAFASDRSTARKPKPPPIERALPNETQLHLAKKELNKYKEQLNNAEITKIQALAELERVKRTVEELTNKLSTLNESKEQALKATEAAESQTKKLEDVSSVESTTRKDAGWEQEFDNAREQYAAAITELDAAKQQLRRVMKDFETSMEGKLTAIQQEAESKLLFDANTEKVAQLSMEISAAQDSLMHVKLAADQARQEESKIHIDKDTAKLSYKQALEETEKKLASLKKEFDPEVHNMLEAKLAETTAEIGVVQKEMEDTRTSDLEFIVTVTSELDGAKEMLQKLAEEESSLRSLVESLKLELEGLKKEHEELKEKDAETESVVGNLHLKLQKCKAELEAAMVAESKATLASDDLVSTLQQLSSESQNASQEAEEMKRSAEELRADSDAAQTTLHEAEKRLQVALKDAEEAKAAEARVLDLIKELSEKANVARASTSQSGANITISKEEYESLTRKVEESGKLAEMKVAAAIAQVEAVRSSENEAVKKLETVRKEMEDIETATEETLKRAEMAEAAKKAVEGELRRWREKEHKMAAKTASRILAETQMLAEALPPKPMVHSAKSVENTEENRKVVTPKLSKKALLQNFSGIFHRKKNQVDGGSPSHLPGEKPFHCCYMLITFMELVWLAPINARLQKPFNKLANDTRILLLAESTLRSLRLSHLRPEATGGSGSIYRRWKAPETSSLISEAEMRWLKKWLASPIKSTRGITAFGLLTRRAPQEIMNGKLHHTSYSLTAILQQFGSGSANVLGNASNPQFDNKRPQTVLHARLIGCRWFSDSAGKERTLNRDWLARLWVEEKRNMEVRRRGRRKRQPAPRVQDRDSGIKETMQQPPISQYDGDLLTPGSPEEVRLVPLLSRANLLITRDIEWANIMFAFEQENRYVIVDACYPQLPVGFIRESSNVIFRQLLRGRRPFVAHIFDAMGNEIFRVRRPFWWINSTIYAEIDGKEVGVVHRRWHLWRRIYDLYLGNKQFAVVENPGFWNWTFTLKDEDDNVLAQIDRDWRGIGFELFTDAGQYVIRFGNSNSLPITEPASGIQELEVARPLTLSERAVAVALAVSLDNDYFSRSRGWGLPILVAGE